MQWDSLEEINIEVKKVTSKKVEEKKVNYPTPGAKEKETHIR